MSVSRQISDGEHSFPGADGFGALLDMRAKTLGHSDMSSFHASWLQGFTVPYNIAQATFATPAIIGSTSSPGLDLCIRLSTGTTFIYSSYSNAKDATRVAFELAACGVYNTELLEYFPFLPSRCQYLDESADFVAAKLLAFARKYMPKTNSAPFRWYQYPFTSTCEYGDDDTLLHPLFYIAGVVKTPTTPLKYLRLFYAYFPYDLNTGAFKGDAPKAPLSEQHSITRSLSYAVGRQVPDSAHALLAIACVDSANLDADKSAKRMVMAMMGDALLRYVVVKNCYDLGYNKSQVSSRITTVLTNNSMSEKFSKSDLASSVVVAANVSIGHGKVGSDFLEAIAFVIYDTMGISALIQYAKYFLFI